MDLFNGGFQMVMVLLLLYISDTFAFEEHNNRFGKPFLAFII